MVPTLVCHTTPPLPFKEPCRPRLAHCVLEWSRGVFSIFPQLPPVCPSFSSSLPRQTFEGDGCVYSPTVQCGASSHHYHSHPSAALLRLHNRRSVVQVAPPSPRLLPPTDSPVPVRSACLHLTDFSSKRESVQIAVLSAENLVAINPADIVSKLRRVEVSADT